MIHVKAQMGDDSTFSLYIEGHARAERNEHDHDLVCCAVSTIIGTLAASCMQIEDVNTIHHGRKGNALVTVTGIPDDLWAEINARYQMAVDGLTSLAAQYPKSLEIECDK